MSVYLDASILVALLTNDMLTDRADEFLRRERPVVVVSDFAAAEFASAVARRVRTGEMTPEDARASFSTLDTWRARVAQRAEVTMADVLTAEAFLRRLDLNLRTPDALNIAIAQRLGAELAGFDEKMNASAQTLGTPLALV